MNTIPLRGLVDVRRDVVDPSVMPEKVEHFSIPALDSGATEIVSSSDIDSHKLHLRGGEVLVSRLNPRKPRVHLVPPSPRAFSVASTEFVPLVPLGAEPRFLRYFLLSEAVRQHLDSQVRSATRSHQRVEVMTILGLQVPTFTVDEQRRIADFLDDRVSRIDRIITSRHQQRKTMVDFREAQLRDAVDATMSLYASTRLGRISKIGSGSFLPSSLFVEDAKFPVFGGNGFAGRFTKCNVQAGTIAVGRVGALCGNVHLLDDDSWLTDNALGVQLVAGSVPTTFVAAVLEAADLNSLASKTAQPLLTGSQVADQRIPIGASEQQIVEIVDAWSALKSLERRELATLEYSVDLFTEYRMSLITAAVAGELDVTTAGSNIPG